jgi:hypothetical protein
MALVRYKEVSLALLRVSKRSGVYEHMRDTVLEVFALLNPVVYERLAY